MALPPNYYGGSAVPAGSQSFNRYTGTQGTYGGGLGMPIQQFGQANPYGPYAGMQKAGAPQTGGGTGLGSGSSGSSSPGDSVARQYLTGVVQGQNTPYNQTTRDSMYSQQSNMAGAAEAARNNQIASQSAMGGASPSDPSYQRLIRQSMAARQGQNQESMGAIDRTANVANQQAQMGAADRLMGSEDERFALQQGYNERATQRAMGYLFGGGGQQSSGANNFNLPQQRNASSISQSADDRAQSDFQYQQRLQQLQEDADYNRSMGR